LKAESQRSDDVSAVVSGLSRLAEVFEVKMVHAQQTNKIRKCSVGRLHLNEGIIGSITKLRAGFRDVPYDGILFLFSYTACIYRE